MKTSKHLLSIVAAVTASILSLNTASAQSFDAGNYQRPALPEVRGLQQSLTPLRQYNGLGSSEIITGQQILGNLSGGRHVYGQDYGGLYGGGATTSAFTILEKPEIQYPANPDGIFGSPLGQAIFAGIPSDILYPTNPDGVVAGAAQLPAGRLILPEELGKVTWNDCAKMSLNLRVAFNTNRSTTPPEAVAFDRACLSPISDIPAPLKDSGIERAVGFLTVKEGDKEIAFCTALRFSKTKIVTAKHCFFDKSRGTTKAQYDYLQYGMVSLYLLADLSKSYVLDYVTLAAPASSAAIPTSDDYVILSVDTGDVDLPAINMTEPEDFQALTTPGINGYLVEDDWRDQLRWSSANMCFVLQLNNGCLVHGCNTTSGFSGAPVFSLYGDGGIEVVGLHSSGGNQDASCGTGLFYQSANMATLMAGNLKADLQ